MYCPGCKREDLTETDFGKGGTMKSGRQVYCRDCDRLKQKAGRDAHLEVVKASSRQYYQNNPDKQREDNRKLRAQRKAAYVAPVNKRLVYEQCGWICQLCGKPVDPNRRWPDLLSATLEHIISIAKGGTHEPGNVQLAHFGCNVRKGTKLSIDHLAH